MYSSFPRLKSAPTPPSLLEFLPLALRCAGAAGATIAKAHGARSSGTSTGAVAHVKGTGGYDQVTETDEECERLIFGMIRADARCADHVFIGEEGCTVHAAAAAADADADAAPFGAVTWICDPLDGTKNFVKGLEHVAVCVALAVQGRARVGVVLCPILSEVFFAVEGHGAYVAPLDVLNSRASTDALAAALEAALPKIGPFVLSALPPGVRRLDRSPSAASMTLIEAMVSTNVGHYRGGNFGAITTQSIGALVSTALGLRMLGSCAIGMCHVAAARSDCYYERNVGGPWDVAAANVVVREAGGVIIDPSGGAFVLTRGKQRILAAASAGLGHELSAVLGPIESNIVGLTEDDATRDARWMQLPAQALLSTVPALAPAACGFLATLTKLDLRGALGSRTTLPASIGAAHALNLLDIGGNNIEVLPNALAGLTSLKILFATGNKLGGGSGQGIAVCARMPALRMISLKENGFVVLDTRLLPAQLEWLIATDNSIASIPHLGSMHAVRKLMLSHNKLTTEALLDAGLGVPGACASLEMVRLADNALESIPSALLRHPRLAWLALGGNPCATTLGPMGGGAGAGAGAGAPTVEWSEVAVDAKRELGAGTSGAVVACEWRGRAGALKMWSGASFSDGTAADEWALNQLVSHPSIVTPLAFVAPPSAPALGMVLEYLPNARPLGGPPTFSTVTRDNPVLSVEKHGFNASGGRAHVEAVARSVCSALRYLHEERGIVHGDVYAHNILVSDDGVGGGVVVKLGDLGAAARYPRGGRNEVEKCEVRCFGWLIADMLGWVDQAGEEGDAEYAQMRQLVARCTARDVDAVPTFGDVQRAMGWAIAAAGL